ncbi:hypothetical protein OG871_25590 [Kitasatospora sp. NBC_00374]|uniref:hypothetical protein n=1 Tax=Kitasatospora sp. NBC_00374 TaxID=2975964 RepID=UPI003243AC26
MPQQRERFAPQAGAAAAGGKSGQGRGRLDLSVAQVAASALATVAGAVLASELGVYGTIIGAAVVSVGATVGSAFFQHLFRRTGEQLRGAVDRGPGATVNGLRQVPAPDAVPVATGEWNEPRLVRARRRWTWRTYAAVSALVFGLAMVPILAVEVVAGEPVSSLTGGDSRTGTSLNPGRGEPVRQPPAEGSTGGSGPAAVPSGPGSVPPGGGAGPLGSPSVGPSGSPGGTPSGSPSGASPSGTPSNGAAASPPGPSGEPSASAAAPSGSPSP